MVVEVQTGTVWRDEVEAYASAYSDDLNTPEDRLNLAALRQVAIQLDERPWNASLVAQFRMILATLEESRRERVTSDDGTEDELLGLMV